MLPVYVLDACSVIALLREEDGYKNVEVILHQVSLGKVQVLLHKVTLTEVTYDLIRSGEYVDVPEILATCYKLPVFIVDDLSDTFIGLAATYKVVHKISFADCFVLALAKTKDAIIVTSDHHEFDAIEKTGELKFEWIR